MWHGGDSGLRRQIPPSHPPPLPVGPGSRHTKTGAGQATLCLPVGLGAGLQEPGSEPEHHARPVQQLLVRLALGERRFLDVEGGGCAGEQTGGRGSGSFSRACISAGTGQGTDRARPHRGDPGTGVLWLCRVRANRALLAAGGDTRQHPRLCPGLWGWQGPEFILAQPLVLLEGGEAARIRCGLRTDRGHSTAFPQRSPDLRPGLGHAQPATADHAPGNVSCPPSREGGHHLMWPCNPLGPSHVGRACSHCLV